MSFRPEPGRDAAKRDGSGRGGEWTLPKSKGMAMNPDLRSTLFPRAALLAFALAGSVAELAETPDEKAFLDDNQAAMTRMMAAMQVQPTGDVDRDFVAMMVPHHQ